jgi:ubiquitin carboxyl-terminal hydrolase 8
MSIAEIKFKATQDVHRATRGISPLALLKGAKTQLASADQYELEGNLKEALSAMHKAAALTKLFLDHNEVGTEKAGKYGVLMKEFKDYEKVRLVSFVSSIDC